MDSSQGISSFDGAVEVYMLANHLDQQQVHESIDFRNQPWPGLRERLVLEKIRREKSWSSGRPGPCTQKEIKELSASHTYQAYVLTSLGATYPVVSSHTSLVTCLSNAEEAEQ